MKSTNTVNSVFLVILVSVSFMSSCQPKDVDMKTAAAAAKAFQNNTADAKPIEMNPNETNALFAVSFDRLAEALVLTKAVLNPEYASSRFLILKPSDQVKAPGEIAELTLESVAPDKQKPMATVSQLSYNVEELSVDANSKLQKLIFVKNIFKAVTAKGDLKTKKGDFSIVNISDRILISATADANLYSVKISRIDTTSSKSDKNTTINFEATYKLAWSGQVSDLNNELQISNIKMQLVRTGNKQGQINFTNDQQNLAIKLDQCVSMNGRLSINIDLAKPDGKITNPAEVVLSDSTVEIPTAKFKSQAQSCDARPVVDLSRLLN